MTGITPEEVAAANDAWVWTPEGSEVVETGEYRLIRAPAHFSDPLQLQWVHTSRPAADVLEDVVVRARGFGLPQLYVYSKISAPADLDEALLARGADLVETCDVLARALDRTATREPAGPAALELRWRTTLEVSRDVNRVGTAVFGGRRADDDFLADRAEADRASIAAGTGGAMVAYLDDTAVGVAGVEVVDGVARLWGGAVLEEHRGRGIYHALLAARTAYAVEHGATLAFTFGRVETSSPILQRLGFTCFGQEHCYRLPLD
jgi:GNAT superfamily N-acetyltransferase